MKKILSFLLWMFIVIWFYGINSNFIFAQQKVWVNIENSGCLAGMGQDCFQYETMMWIKNYQPGSGYTATSIAQDVVVSATYMVWTVLTIIIIICWLWYIFSSTWGKGLFGKSPSDYKSWLIKAAIWAVLVRWAYAIVRLIQYIAKW